MTILTQIPGANEPVLSVFSSDGTDNLSRVNALCRRCALAARLHSGRRSARGQQAAVVLGVYETWRLGGGGTNAGTVSKCSCGLDVLGV